MKRTTISDYSNIISTVQKYLDGCNEGKSQIMKPAFDDEAVMFGAKADGTLEAKGTINNLYAIVDSVGADENGQSRIDVLDSTPTTAVVRVIIENWHGLTFTDYHSLIKIDGQWKIVAKVYNTFAE